MKVLISPAHHLLDIKSQSEHYLSAKIIEGLASLDPNIEYHVLCGFFAHKETLPKNIKIYELYKGPDIHLSVFVLIYFYAWLLFKSIWLSIINRFDLVWHFLPSGEYSLNLFMLLRLHRLFGIKRSILGRLSIGFHDDQNSLDYIVQIKDGQRTFARDNLKFILDLIYLIMGNFTRSYLKSFDTLVFYTHAAKNYYQKITKIDFETKRTAIIPVGFDETQFSFVTKNYQQPWKFLFVGALVNRKRPLVLINFAKKLLALNIDFTIHIIGKGYLAEKLQRLISDNNLEKNLIITGPIAKEEVRKFYQKSHFLLSLSDAEGFTHTLLESWATGTIFLGSKIDVNIELVSEGKTGFLFDPQQEAELDRIIDIIVKTKTEDLEKIANNALEHSKQFTWKNIIQSYYNLIIHPADNKYK